MAQVPMPPVRVLARDRELPAEVSERTSRVVRDGKETHFFAIQDQKAWMRYVEALSANFTLAL